MITEKNKNQKTKNTLKQNCIVAYRITTAIVIGIPLFLIHISCALFLNYFKKPKQF